MSDADLNVAPWERWASILSGAALIARAVARPTPLSIALAAGGALLLERGVTGHCRVYRTLGHSTWDDPAAAAHRMIDTASDDSFPASDPPSWTSTSSVGTPRRAH